MRMPYENLIAQGRPAGRLMDDVGDGSGSIDMRVDGSSTAADFKVTVPTGHTYLIVSMHIIMVDTLITPSKFSGGAALTVGIDVGEIKDDVFSSFIPQETVKSNADLAVLGVNFNSIISATADDNLVGNLRFREVYGGYRKMDAGSSYTVRVQDDMSGAAYGAVLQVKLNYLDIAHTVISSGNDGELVTLGGEFATIGGEEVTW